jgi:hypothetical protein
MKVELLLMEQTLQDLQQSSDENDASKTILKMRQQIFALQEQNRLITEQVAA